MRRNGVSNVISSPVSSTVSSAVRLIAIVVTTGVIAAACGGGASQDANLQGLDEQVGFDGSTVVVRQIRAENLIRDCMRSQGFDYVPVDPVAQQAALVGSQGLSKDDFEAQFGYGITTLYEQRLQQAAAGPNEVVRSALSEADRAAYDRTLYGDDPTATFAVALDTGEFNRLGGCVKQATEEVFGGADLLYGLTDKLDQLDEQILADPRMVKAVEQWSGCMRNAGYELQNPDEVDVVLQRKLEEIVGPLDNQKSDYDRAALAALQREEVAMVTADLTCEDKHISTVEDKVQTEYERRFREQNAAELSKVPPP